MTTDTRTLAPAWLRRRRWMPVVAMVVALLASPATLPSKAQEKYPARPIEMIIPTPPGGGVDITGRMLVELVEPLLGTKVLVVNVPGASGAVGVSRLVGAKPDGYTIAYVWNAPLTVAPHVLQVSYTPQDYIPVTQVTGATPLVYCVRPDFPAQNAKDFVELIRKNPNKYVYGNDGVGAMVHLAAERLFQPLNMKMRAVPFGGAGETLRAFLGAQIDVYGGSIPPLAPHLKDGKAKCLIASTAGRNAQAPDAASATELGLADKATELWRGVIVPKGTPAERVQILQDAFRKAAAAPIFKDYETKSGDTMIGSTSEAFGRLILSEHADFGRIVAGLGIKK